MKGSNRKIVSNLFVTTLYFYMGGEIMRPDPNRDRDSRLKKILGVAAGVTAGAFLMKEHGGFKMMSKAIGDIGQTAAKVSDDLSKLSFKEMDAKNLGSIARKRLLNDDSTYKTLRSQTNRVNIGPTSLGNSLKKMMDIANNRTNLTKEMEDNILAGQMIKTIQSSFKKESREFFEQTQILTRDVLKKRNQFFEIDTDGSYRALKEEFQERLNSSVFKDKEDKIVNVMETALNEAKRLEGEITQDYQNNLKNQIVGKYKEEIVNKYTKEDDFFKGTLDRAATVNDFFTAVRNESVELTDDVNNLYNSLIDAKEKLGFGDEFYDLQIDSKTLRMDAKNQFYSLKDLKKVKDTLMEEVADTIPGKLAGMRAHIGNSQAPDFFYIGQGTYDKILASLTGEDTGILKYDHFKIGDKFFQYSNGTLNHLKEADNLYLSASSHGQQARLMNRLFGNESYKNVTNKAAQRFDLGTVGESSIEGYKSKLRKFNKNSDWYPNVVKRLLNDTYDNIDGDDVLLASFNKDLRTVHKMYSDQTFAPSRRTINAFREVVGADSLKVLDALDSDNIAQSLLDNFDIKTFKNKDLGTLLKKYESNPNVVNTSVHIGDMKGMAGGKNVLDFNQLLKREAFKETLLRESGKGAQRFNGYAATMAKLEDLNLPGADKSNAKNLLNWTIFQKESDMYAKTMHMETSKEFKMSRYEYLNNLLKSRNKNAQEQAFLESFQEGLKSFAKKNSSLGNTISKEAPDIMRGHQNNEYTTMRKSINVLDLIRDMNDATKRGETLKKFGKQFVAGRNNVDDVTTATLFPFHMLNRLTTPLESLGVGFSSKSTGNVGELAKNIGLKRILPVAGALYGLSYLNYESEQLTGTSLEEAYENTKANFTLGIKTIQDTFGLHDFGRRQRMYNPVAQYWGGDYKDKDEYLDYLEYGYDPVRKGRFWSFGSSSEFRGTKIAYWKPNSLRLAHSNYYDESVYGGSENKWKHSLIPTLRHPFSPIRYLMNPYWLEDMHYEDRPYPVTGKMFQEGTPWGAVLNPTIGELIKPQKRMHEEELQGTLTDVRSIIQERNQAIKDQSAENNIVRLNNSGFMPMAFMPKSQPSLNEAVFNMQVQDGRITSAGFQGQDYAENLGDITTAKFAYGDDVSIATSGAVTRVNSYDKMTSSDNRGIASSFIRSITGFVSSGSVSGGMALNMISQVNRSITDSAELKRSGVFNEKGNLHVKPMTEAAERTKTAYLEDVLDNSSKSDFVADMLYSTKQLSGMYGFLFDQVIPAKKSYELEHAGKMGSFSDKFWDTSVGGLGGDFMEIARRFFPHEDRSIEKINTIRNTMPEWLPGRFQLGDPYTKVPLGDARLPGRGYESLNPLHSDEYGRYGAFDRYKILADIAPNTEEYKTWKKIAKQTVKDPFLIEQMEQIEYRVREQTKEHDFYDYKFINKKLASHTAVIEEVTNTGKFKIVGDDTQYSLAGIKPLKDQETGSYVHQYLKPGMQVELKYEDNEFRNRNSKGEISTLVYFGGESITRQMFENKHAKEKIDKETLADEYFGLTDSNIFMGHFWEGLAHAPIPYIHNKYLRIDSPLEAYKKEQVYGTSYVTWDHPIEGFIKPAFQEAWGRGPGYQALGIATFALSNYASLNWDAGVKSTLAHTAFALTNPGGFAGGVIGALPRMNLGSNNSRIGWNARNFANAGAVIGAVGYGLANLDNPLLSAANFSVAGAAISNQLFHESKQGALVGAAVGLGLSALKNPEFSLSKLTEKYIPKDTKKKWEIEEYFDRLEYIKYTNLYEQAARKAKRKEGIDVKKIINSFEYNREKNIDKIRELEEQKKNAEKNIIDENLRNETIAAIDQQIMDLQTTEQYFGMGKYTKAALAYKKAAETTIYGLNEYSSVGDVLRALPKYDRDFFLEFAKEKDPKARKKILEMVSPYKKRALDVLWKEDLDDPESNREFFKTHNLPNMFWGGWSPQVDLDNVKITTIENEGMLLSDFGIYESQKDEPAAMMAPGIRDMHAAPSPLAMQRDLLGLLNGVGLQDVDVVVEPASQSGIQIISNITRIASYNIEQRLRDTLYNIF